MKISYGSLLFQKTKLEFEDTQKHSRTTVWECDKLHLQYDLCVGMWACAHAMTRPATLSLIYPIDMVLIKMCILFSWN